MGATCAEEEGGEGRRAASDAEDEGGEDGEGRNAAADAEDEGGEGRRAASDAKGEGGEGRRAAACTESLAARCASCSERRMALVELCCVSLIEFAGAATASCRGGLATAGCATSVVGTARSGSMEKASSW